MILASEYHKLTYVPKENWSFYGTALNPGRCDISISHGRARHFLKTPDNRALAVCGKCFENLILPVAPHLFGQLEEMFPPQEALVTAPAMCPPPPDAHILTDEELGLEEL